MSLNPRSIKNFPADDLSLKIVTKDNHIYVIRRNYFWDSEKQRGSEQREYVGKIVNDRFYTMEQYKRHFKRNGEPRAFPKQGIIKSRVKKAKDNSLGTSDTSNTNVLNQNLAAEKNNQDKSQAPSDIVIDSKTNKKAASPKHEQTTACTLESLDQSPSSTNIVNAKFCGEVMLLDKLAEQIHLKDDLSKIFEEQTVNALLSLAYFYLIDRQNASYLYHLWRQKYCSPFEPNLSAKDLTEFFAQIGLNETKINEFFKARADRLDSDETFSYDATNCATDAEDIELAQIGKAKDGSYRKQISMALLFAHKQGLPVAYRLFPGNITDVSTLHDFLVRFDDLGINAGCTVLDRGYFSKQNIANLIRQGCNTVIAAKSNAEWIQNAINEAIPRINTNYNRVAHDVLGETIKTTFDDNNGNTFTAYVHVYCDLLRKRNEINAFLDDLEAFEYSWKNCSNEKNAELLKKDSMLKWFEPPHCEPGNGALVRNTKDIAYNMDRCGIFTNVSTMECTAAFAIGTYRHRDSVEKCFMTGKSSFDMGKIRSHSNETMSGRIFVSFLALILACELNNRMNSEEGIIERSGSAKYLRDDFASSYELLAYVSPIRGCKGYISEVTQRQKSIAKRLGLDGVFESFPEHLNL